VAGLGTGAGRPIGEGERFRAFILLLRRTQCAQLEEINEQLGEMARNPELMSNSMLRAIQRHKELQQDNMRELKRTKVGY
jgi:Golgi SNAP receptor complex protein 1